MKLANKITLMLDTIDGLHQQRHFVTIAGARKYAHAHVGPHPTQSEVFRYGVSDDGVAKITVYGCRFDEIFPEPK